METLLQSFVLVFAGEMGDKTQLLALILAARYRRPWTILLGIFIATVLNHWLVAWLGQWSSGFLSSEALRWVLGLLFLGFAVWILFPDKMETNEKPDRWGPLATTIVVFFLAEMGDKTQLATLALGAQHSSVPLVTLGTTLGMLASNALAIFLGEHLLKKIPMSIVRKIASLLFALFGIAILVGGPNL